MSRTVEDVSNGKGANTRELVRRDVIIGAGITLASLPVAARAATVAASHTPLPPVRQVHAGTLSIGYVEYGPANGRPVLLIHGWPYDIHSFAEVAPILAAQGLRVIVPHVRGFGTTRFLSAETARNAQQAILATDVIALMDVLKIERATISGFDWGARSACIVAALWPERCVGLVSVSGYLIGSQQAGQAPLPPKAELAWWYQFYFATERGRAGYAANCRAFNKQIWRLASPRWSFDENTFARSATSFDNPDHTAIVIHNYRWRLGIVDGEPKLQAIEDRLAASPPIAVPTITMEGDANGAPHPEPASYRARFTSRYEHRLIRGGDRAQSPAGGAEGVRRGYPVGRFRSLRCIRPEPSRGLRAKRLPTSRGARPRPCIVPGRGRTFV
ncbi:pimeloyl-ACP methyl ester carboxylesterase [Novosphingobium chloroacetimidivorans]|uniref:Pimeloyl-ACP methyl ester carboxylesterase n=1 Tax=Novosphingobium chloroacetimidivorans TaxID=1428314 RepID=A0A7W7NW81_9SPHN|nr:alpha/beta hydrolase [Novosphingobium chloroacetimidivorans]MBB4859283.1 pimeloyl-ACP methyl ester carboxylesterase [Novosphingobium chloroacetimidivorans]